MREMSIFVDESGDQVGRSKYYVLTFVFHNQAYSLAKALEEHRIGLMRRGLRDIPFHAGPIMSGHDEYGGMDFPTRKTYFTLFFQDLQHLPITYHAFLYKRSEYQDVDELTARMRRDIANFLFDNLTLFQSFESIKIYYDNGQDIVVRALHAAVEYALSRNCLLYRLAKPSDFMLSQAADMLCALELTARKFECGEQTRTDEKMFGGVRSFKKNYLKFVKRMRV